MNITTESFEMPKRLTRIFTTFMAVGAATLVAGLLVSPGKLLPALFLTTFFLLTAGLGGIVFVALQYVASAGWGTSLRRIPEAMGSVAPTAALLFFAALVACRSLYSWSGGFEHAAGGMWFKEFWLDMPFFIGRAAGYLIIWTLFTHFIIRNSRLQDADGALVYTQRNTTMSTVFIVLFALTFWLASFDWIMSLDPTWFSTIFGVYNFSGMMLAALASMVYLLIWLNRLGIIKDIPNEEHLHSLGKFMFGFSCFWAYIWFSQYMLIWYANIPEETNYYVARMRGGWGTIFLLNFALNWAAPFLLLMPRAAKRNPDIMIKGAMVILVGRWLDIYLMVYPSHYKSGPVFGVFEVGLTIGALGLFCSLFFRALGKAHTMPVRDPYLSESLPAHH